MVMLMMVMVVMMMVMMLMVMVVMMMMVMMMMVMMMVLMMEHGRKRTRNERHTHGLGAALRRTGLVRLKGHHRRTNPCRVVCLDCGGESSGTTARADGARAREGRGEGHRTARGKGGAKSGGAEAVKNGEVKS